MIDFNFLGPQTDHDGNKDTIFLHANGAAVAQGNIWIKTSKSTFYTKATANISITS